MVAAAELIDGVHQKAFEDGEAVAHPAGGARQVHDEGADSDSGEAAGERGRGDLVAALGTDRLGDAGDLVVEDAAGGLGVRSVGEMPVPPVVTMTSYAAATPARRARSTGSPSGTTCGPSTAKPSAASASTIRGPPRSA